MALDFVAIDFETANTFRGSPCSVGIVHVRNGHIVDTSSTLINQTEFDPFCIAIHGIKQQDVANALAFSQYWPTLLEEIGVLPLVAHNAAFDTGVIRDALSANDLPWPNISYACTLVMSRRTYDLPSYRLPFVAQEAGIQFDINRHHQADTDAEIAARILLDIAQRNETDDLEDLAKKMGLRLGRITSKDWQGCKSKSHHGYSNKHSEWLNASVKDVVINPDADPNNPLFGAGVTFTGTLSSMTRTLAWQQVGACGGMPLDGVTKKTNLLVFGYQDATKLTPGANLSSKYKKALDLKSQGVDIEIIGEDDFLNMLQEVEVTRHL